MDVREYRRGEAAHPSEATGERRPQRLRDRPRSAPPGASRQTTSLPLAFVDPSRDACRESEKLGLVVATLAHERYGAVLELGCGSGGLAVLLRERCARYTGLDGDLAALAEARARVADGRFARLVTPLALPPGEHELVVLADFLQRLDVGSVAPLADALAAHRPCGEIVVVSPCDEDASGADGALGTLLGTLRTAFVHEERALRRRYRVDAFLRPAR